MTNVSFFIKLKYLILDGTFKDLRDLSFTVDTLTEELKRLKGGPLVKEMIQHFDSIASNHITSKEMYEFQRKE